MPGREPILYTLSFPHPRTHYAEVEAEVPTSGASSLGLRLAVWTPGSYLVREYAKHIEGFRAHGPDGAELAVEKPRKNRWTIETRGAARVRVAYRVYCHEMTVRSNWVEEGFALINGAPTFVTTLPEDDAPDDRGPPARVRVRLPDGWRHAISAMPSATAGSAERGEGRSSGGSVPSPASAPPGEDPCFEAADFDQLVDSPIVLGSPAVYEFETGGKPHLLVNIEEGGVWDGPRSAKDVERIVATEHVFWGEVPYDRYVFFNLITEAGGGLEHADSTVLMTSRWKSRSRKAYLDWLALVCHEFFHTWNVKRLRPVELGPFDYESETYTTSLWVAEGITNYYTDLLVRRSGLVSETEYFERFSRLIERHELAIGRSVQTLEESSFDAWIKLYRPDENSLNATISYYVKGAMVAFLLDATIRRRTNDEVTLDDVVREAYRRFSGARGFESREFEALASELAGESLDEWFDVALRSTRELDYAEAFDWWGLRFKESKTTSASELAADGGANGNGGGSSDDDDRGRRSTAAAGDSTTTTTTKPTSGRGSAASPPAWFGVATRREGGGRLIVTRVVRGSPASRDGVNVGDEIVALDGYRVLEDAWSERLGHYRPGDRVEVLVARREKLIPLEVELEARPAQRWRLEPSPDATPDQKKRRKAWLATVARPPRKES